METTDELENIAVQVRKNNPKKKMKNFEVHYLTSNSIEQKAKQTSTAEKQTSQNLGTLNNQTNRQNLIPLNIPNTKICSKPNLPDLKNTH